MLKFVFKQIYLRKIRKSTFFIVFHIILPPLYIYFAFLKDKLINSVNFIENHAFDGTKGNIPLAN